MTPQEWIEIAKFVDTAGSLASSVEVREHYFVAEGAQHLAAALEEIVRLQAQLSQVQAERVVVPELTKNDLDREIGEDLWKYAHPGTRITFSAAAQRDKTKIMFSAGYRFAASRTNSVPSSRVLKDGEVVVSEAELAALREFANGWSEFRSQFDDIQYHHLGMGCGIEDRGIHDRYAACEHGWECAMNRVAERFPEIDTLDALRAQGKEGAT